MPSAQMGSFGHLKLKGVCVLSLQRPSHIASVLEVLISSPDIDLNSSSSLKTFSTDSSSLKAGFHMIADRRSQIAESSAIVCDHMETHFCDRLRSSAILRS